MTRRLKVLPGEMDDGKKVWVAHALDGYKLGRIVDLGADGVTVELLERPPGQKVSVPFDNAFPADEYDNKDVDDNCKQSFLRWAYPPHPPYVTEANMITNLVQIRVPQEGPENVLQQFLSRSVMLERDLAMG